jgi:hypothetical protein
MRWGTLIGLAAGAWLSYRFVLPADVLDLKPGALSIGDLLCIFVSCAIPLAAAGIGHFLHIILGDAD